MRRLLMLGYCPSPSGIISRVKSSCKNIIVMRILKLWMMAAMLLVDFVFGLTLKAI